MKYFLLKTEPISFSIDDLKKVQTTVWDGVKNPLAIKYLRTISIGDLCFIYHTGSEKSIVGLGEAVSGAYSDNGGMVVFDISFKKRYPSPLRLSAIKNNKLLSEFELTRQPRLSIMPVPNQIADKIIQKCDSIS